MFDVNILLQSRLAPDQFPFVRQVQSASDAAKGLAPRLNGQTPPSLPDSEQTMEELKARIDKTIEILKAIKPEEIEGKEDYMGVVLPFMLDKKLNGFSYAIELVVPNFYFHLITAYAILRHNGVDIGKSDYIGSLPLTNEA